MFERQIICGGSRFGEPDESPGPLAIPGKTCPLPELRRDYPGPSLERRSAQTLSAPPEVSPGTSPAGLRSTERDRKEPDDACLPTSLASSRAMGEVNCPAMVQSEGIVMTRFFNEVFAARGIRQCAVAPRAGVPFWSVGLVARPEVADVQRRAASP